MKQNQAPSLLAALMTWGFSSASINTSAECPNIGVTYGHIYYHSRSSASTRDSTVRCCLHDLNLIVMYEDLESCDVCILHDITLKRNPKHRIGGSM